MTDQDRSHGEKRSVSILGVTGTIGQHTANLILEHPDSYRTVSITAHRSVDKLVELAHALKPEFVALADASLHGELKAKLDGTGIASGAGPEALIEAGTRAADWIMASIVGAAGLEPTLAAVRQGTTVGLANKECLVCAGDVFMAEAGRCKTTLLPVDSEHSAIFQALDSLDCKSVDKILVTASGGPFRTWTLEQLAHVKIEDALKHPNWTMGQKITIDSATLMNKGLEIIEAYHLFNVRHDQLGAIVHPQSILHCLVYYSDGSVIAQASLPDMRTPIAYSLGWPNRLETNYPRLDLAKIGQLTFEEPDEARFPALRLAREAMVAGGVAPTVLNAANEIAVEAFLNRQIAFMDIPALVEDTLNAAKNSVLNSASDTLESVLDVDASARHITRDLIDRAKTKHSMHSLNTPARA